MNFSIDKQPSDYLKWIAQREKALRKQCGYTQAQMAAKSDVSLGSLTRFEQTGEISLSSLLKLAQVLETLPAFGELFPPRKEIDKEVLQLFEK